MKLVDTIKLWDVQQERSIFGLFKFHLDQLEILIDEWVDVVLDSLTVRRISNKFLDLQQIQPLIFLRIHSSICFYAAVFG